MAWQEARLIPTSGISNESEAEVRATSALLAVLSIVRPFSNAVLSPLGASRASSATVETFIETTFKTKSGKTFRPDGLVRVSYGKQDPWVALVEVKTANAKLGAEQIESYLAIAKEQGYDCVVTISNEIAPSPGLHPTAGVKVRANSKVELHHLSWTKLLTVAVTEKVHRGVADPEQAWILGELIRYLEHPKSGTVAFDDMGENWVDVRDGARDGTLNRRHDSVTDIAQRWDQLLGYASLKLGADIGRDVTELVPRAQQHDPALRTKSFVESLATSGTLHGQFRIPRHRRRPRHLDRPKGTPNRAFRHPGRAQRQRRPRTDWVAATAAEGRAQQPRHRVLPEERPQRHGSTALVRYRGPSRAPRTGQEGPGKIHACCPLRIRNQSASKPQAWLYPVRHCRNRVFLRRCASEPHRPPTQCTTARP